MSTTWFIAKEYLKRLEIDFEEHGRKTFSARPERHVEAKVIEIFPGKDWITLTTRLMDLENLSANEREKVYERLLRANATLVEVNFGIDRKSCLMLRSAVPVTGISYDLFSCIYEAHMAATKFFFEKMKDELFRE